MKRILAIATILFFVCSMGISQNRITLKPEKSYTLAKVYTKKNKIQKVRNLVLINDSTISYKNKGSFKDESISVYDLRTLKIKTGTKALPYGLYGGGLMALSCLYAYLDVESDPYYSSIETNYAPLFTGLIVGGTVVGALIGMATPKWSMVSLPRKKPNTSSLLIKPVFEQKHNYVAFKLTLGF